MHQPVSVCHQWSIDRHLQLLLRPFARSAGSARSPARNRVRNFDRSYCRMNLPSGSSFRMRAERGRRGEQRDRLVLGDHAPECAGIGRADRLALVHDRGRAVQQRAVDDVAVADHPADVGAAPPDLARLDAIEVEHRPFQRDQMAAIVAHARPSACRSCRRCRGCRADRWRRPARRAALAVVHRLAAQAQSIVAPGPRSGRR